MFTRMVEIKTKRGKAKDLCHTIHTKVLSILGAQPGFVDEIVLVSDTEADRVVAMSYWKSRADAERYRREHYPRVREILGDQIHSIPRVRTFGVETSTAYNVARGKRPS